MKDETAINRRSSLRLDCSRAGLKPLVLFPIGLKALNKEAAVSATRTYIRVQVFSTFDCQAPSSLHNYTRHHVIPSAIRYVDRGE